jgi:uroporphyrin-III C-methyltransferase
MPDGQLAPTTIKNTSFTGDVQIRWPLPASCRVQRQWKEAAMSAEEPIAIPEFGYGTVWLVGAGDGDPHRLSPLALHALATADAVIHDAAIPQLVLDLVRPPRYREAALPGRGTERSIKLAEDGWRVVHLVEGDAAERAIEGAALFAEHRIPFYVTSNAANPGEARIGLLLVRRLASSGPLDTNALVLLIAPLTLAGQADVERRLPPLSFSMNGLAG